MTNQLKRKPIFPSIIETKWYVAFTDNQGPVKWWNIFTRPGFRHVYMYTQMREYTLVLSMTRGGLVIMSMPLEGPDAPVCTHEYLRQTYKAHTILPVTGLVAASIGIPRRAPFTCVELARSVLGIDKMLFTPHQLYEWLKDNRLAGEPL